MAVNLGHFNLFLISLITPLYFLYVFIYACFAKRNKTRKFTVGFFHPYCNAGGGGERVLWVALRSLQQKYPDYQFVVYTGDVDVSPEEIIGNAKSRFNIALSRDNIEFVFLRQRDWVEAFKYPSFTLLGQSIGSILLGLEAILAVNPDVFIDTMGYAFTFPVFKYLGGASVACYVHYPTISTDMLNRVESGEASYNNKGFVASSPTLSKAKLAYYKTFATLYSWMGRASDSIMVNSSWTENHINSLWKVGERTHKVYPPCDVDEFKRIPQPEDDSSKEEYRIVSVAQFRPEKNHALQLQSISQLKTLVAPAVWRKIKLVLVGSVRNEGDEGRVKDLRELCDKLELNDNVEFHLNVSFAELKKQFGESMMGIHSMWNEHFGIGIVECMAAGLIMVAHKSGGPLMDIVVDGNGFLAESEKEYAEVIRKVLRLSPRERHQIRTKARKSVERFSEAQFIDKFLSVVEPLLK